MTLTETKFNGVYIFNSTTLIDERGFLSISDFQDIFKQHNISIDLIQYNISMNNKKGTIRGMHFQADPHAQAKLVRCIRGAAYDVIIDLRPGPTQYQWLSTELTEDNQLSIFIPTGFAHGFQTITDNTLVLYHIDHPYHPDSTRGIRWNDTAFKIKWPLQPFIISDRDKEYLDYNK